MQDVPSVWPALLAFLAVIALIPVALWVLKRLQSGGAPGQRVVTLIGGLTLGPRERVAVIEAQGRRWMIGITGQSISLLAELDRAAGSVPGAVPSAPMPGGAIATPPNPPANPPTNPPTNPFSQMLDRMKRHG